MVIPGKNSWIPHFTVRNPTGPIHLLLKNENCVPYTNYTFMPLTLTPNYVLNSPNACANKQINIIIIVHSAASNFQRRNVLRETWLNSVLLEKMSSQHVFLLGKTHNATTQDMISEERQIHGDIVQGDFIDDYHNLTHKAVLGLNWIYEICKNARFVLKVDDDVYLNIFRLMDEILPSVQYSPYSIMCNVHHDLDVVRHGKWAVDIDYFPTCTLYPFPYCGGGFALFSSTVVPLLLDLAHSVPFIWIDDVYVYGILANMAASVSLHHIDGLFNKEIEALECFQNDNDCRMIMAFTNSTKIMKFFWSKALSTECSNHGEVCDAYMFQTRKSREIYGKRQQNRSLIELQ
ncbi:hypothetical protein ACJMK2_007285 [Sinanodonta woodiana]|uniref:Hexosyltransferase n=1 Tax=Sinanodonta woodiana TaxID=1069815 RepID=A0ABD3VIA7_SINWO